MAEAAGEAVPAPLHGGLPDEVVVWEILVRLPPKSLLRCRAVSPAWRRATSTRDFLLAHHARQPSLPLLCGYDLSGAGDRVALDLIPFDAALGQLQSVARLGTSFFGLEASCDGLLVLSGLYRNFGFSICNPATRQHARLPHLDGFALLGMYPHSPSREYRLLLGKPSYAPANQDGYYVFPLGSDQPPRRTRCLDADDRVCEASSVLFHGSLHWHVHREESGSMIRVFDTTTGLLRKMRAPAVRGYAALFEMDGMLYLSTSNYANTIIDVWVMQDYESEAWASRYRVELPVAELIVQFGSFHGQWRVIPSWDGHVLVLAKFGEWLLQIDTDGKLLASFRRPLQCTNQLRLKQSLVQHAFFPTLEGYVVNGSPFI